MNVISGSTGGSQPGSRPLRVLGWPAFSNRHDQPYNWLLYTHLRDLGVEVEEYSMRRALSGRFSVLHLHWRERRVRDPSPVMAVARSGALLALLDAVRLRGTKVMWTVHNLQAHEGRYHPWLEPGFWTRFTRRLDGYISLSESAREIAREQFPGLRDTPGFVTPHGHYRPAYPEGVTRREARASLGFPPDRPVIAFVGQIRPYKNVVHLVRTFRGISDPEVTLLIAGKVKPPELAGEILSAAEGDPRIRLVPKFVANEDLPLYLGAADLVVLPYREILNSGSAMLALSFDRPVLVPHQGSMTDLAVYVGPDWVRTYSNELEPDDLRGAITWAMRLDRPLRPSLQRFDWTAIARATRDAYLAIGAGARPAGHGA